MFLNTILGFTPFWDYKPTDASHADSPGVYTSDKISNLSTIDKIHLKCHVIDGIVVIGIREPILFSFVLDNASGFKEFSEPEKLHFKKMSGLNTTSSYLQDNNHKEVNFDGETLTFTL